MLASTSSATSASWTYLNGSTQDPTAGRNQSDQTNPNQQPKPVNTAIAVAELRKIEESIAKELQEVEASAGSAAGQVMVGLLTTQLTAIQAQIDNIVGLNSMRTQNHSVTALQSNSNGQNLRMLNQVQMPQQRKPLTDVADGNTTSDGAAVKLFRFDLTGSFVDEIA